MQPAKLNYKIYDKELLVVYEAFKHWHTYLEGMSHSILVMSDHKNLEYFTTTKVLTWCQAHWSEFLSGFVHNICYHPGKLGAKPDALMCRRDVYPQGEEGTYTLANAHNIQMIIKSSQLLASFILDLASSLSLIREGVQHNKFTMCQILLLNAPTPHQDSTSL